MAPETELGGSRALLAGPAPQRLERSTFTAPESLRATSPDWGRMLEEHGAVTLDAHPDFFRGALEWIEPRPEPYVVVWRDGGRPRALLVARLRRMRVPCRLGYLRLHTGMLRCCEVVYGGLVTDGSEVAQDCLLAHLDEMLASGAVDQISLHHVGEDDPLLPRLLQGLPAARRGPSSRECHWRTEFCDAQTGEAIEPYSGKTRRRLRRYDNALVRSFDGQVEIETVTREEEIAHFLPRAAAIARGSYHDALGVGIQDDAYWGGMLRLLARLGMLRAYLLVAKGQPIAYEVAAVYGNRCTLIVQSFLPRFGELKPGNFLLRHVIESAREEGVATLDYGFGDSHHKRLFGTHSSYETTLDFYARGMRATSAWLLVTATTAVSSALVRLARATGLFDAIKKRWRRALQRGR